MFKGRHDSAREAERVAKHLADHSKFKSHTRHIDMHKAMDLGLEVTPLEDDQKLQDLVLSVFHATTIVFNRPIVKIIENHLGNAFIKQQPLPPSMLPPPGAGS